MLLSGSFLFLLGLTTQEDEPEMRYLMIYAKEKMEKPGYCETAVEYDTYMFPAHVEYDTYKKARNALRKSKSSQNEERTYTQRMVTLKPNDFAVVYSVTYDHCDGLRKDFFLMKTESTEGVDEIIKEKVNTSLVGDYYVSHSIEHMDQPFQPEKSGFWDIFLNNFKEFIQYLSEEEQSEIEKELKIQKNRALGPGVRG